MEKQPCIETVIPDGHVVIYQIKDGPKSKPIGSVVISIYDHYIEVLHIYVEKEFRGKGYAQKLVTHLQESFDYIVTGWKGSEKEGRNLFLKMGFMVISPLHKSRNSTLEWVKKCLTKKK